MSDEIAADAELEEKLNMIGQEGKPSDAPGVFFNVPNLGHVNAHLVTRLFVWACAKQYKCWFRIGPIDGKFHDYARNMVVETALKERQDCEWVIQIDNDVVPPYRFLEVLDHGKDIIAPVVFAWIGGALRPSVWKRAECEQCRVAKVYMETGDNHDPEQYQIREGSLFKWNPFTQDWSRFIRREDGKYFSECRCKKTGVDPFMFRVQEWNPKDTILKVDSVGAAALAVRRKVFEAIDPPWFQFLFKPNRKIMLTEDHYFCWKAGIYGFETWSDVQMPCSHFKEVDLLQVFQFMVGVGERVKESLSKDVKRVILPSEDVKIIR